MNTVTISSLELDDILYALELCAQELEAAENSDDYTPTTGANEAIRECLTMLNGYQDALQRQLEEEIDEEFDVLDGAPNYADPFDGDYY